MHTPIYSQEDYVAITKQMKQRWKLLLIPCAVMLVILILAVTNRIEWLTSLCTILIGITLIAGYDLGIKPLNCYAQHLNNCLKGRTHTCDLPFIRLSENIDLVDGVEYRQLLCSDIDGKGRPYERLFYFDAMKTLPDFQEGEIVHIVHHSLEVADISRA